MSGPALGGRPVKAIALLRCKPGLSREAFVAYYETRHAPLIRALLPEIGEYRRNYVEPAGAFTSPVAAIDFDCVSELRFADRATYDRFVARAADPAIARAIAEDEEHLFDRAATRMFVVSETAVAPLPAGIAELADELAVLRAERAVRDGLARFARVLDTKDWAALGDVFAADLTFDYGLGEQAGMAALTDNMRRFLDFCGPSQHLIGSIVVEVGPDRRSAVSRAYVQARHQRRDDPVGPVFDTNGEYRDHWALRPEGWRIVRRDAVWQSHSGDPGVLYPAPD
ncbi:nuclear transport factor 2 family protein [Novosphingobium flavum]|uniref:nuclear transport factor 2 family protein n=1 Tax=Novosphingobium aerophilum TaxID=2839843 RepID=UPI00163A3BE4|nr:nuclear transport factor 2 family protein [Novosphingobium aerophilum]MBC2660220.1 nuclear transport factor 2 family protein [Novosphingobium aerophilum]